MRVASLLTALGAAVVVCVAFVALAGSSARQAGRVELQIWLYAGKETYLDGHGKEIGDLKSILRRGHYQTKVMTWNSLAVAPVRSVCWDHTTHVMIFPPFAEYPDIHDIARKDLRA